MFVYLINRLMQALGAMLFVALVAFVMFNFVGDGLRDAADPYH